MRARLFELSIDEVDVEAGLMGDEPQARRANELD
jgi:hypothetical protein